MKTLENFGIFGQIPALMIEIPRLGSISLTTGHSGPSPTGQVGAAACVFGRDSELPEINQEKLTRGYLRMLFNDSSVRLMGRVMSTMVPLASTTIVRGPPLEKTMYFSS